MNAPKRTVHLTDDNFLDYLPLDYAEQLVEGLVLGENGIDRYDPIVTKFIDWVAHVSDLSPETQYVLTRGDAAVILELLAAD
jgi:hypothetical protein